MVLANGVVASTPLGAETIGEKSVLLPALSNLLDMWNDFWTGDGTLPSAGGAGTILYEHQPTRDQPVVGVGHFHIVRRDINPGNFHPCLFPGCRSCICICGLTMILGWTLSSPDDGYSMYDPRPMSGD